MVGRGRIPSGWTLAQAEVLTASVDDELVFAHMPLIGTGGDGRCGDPFDQFEDEVVLVDLLGDGDDVA